MRVWRKQPVVLSASVVRDEKRVKKTRKKEIQKVNKY
jgi:hypothetical protein